MPRFEQQDLFAGTSLARSETRRAIDAEILRRERLEHNSTLDPETLPLFNKEYQFTVQSTIFSGHKA